MGSRMEDWLARTFRIPDWTITGGKYVPSPPLVERQYPIGFRDFALREERTVSVLRGPPAPSQSCSIRSVGPVCVAALFHMGIFFC